MKLFVAVLGAIVGMLLVRGFFLDNMEELGWRLFWHEFQKGGIDGAAMRKVVNSATFTKLVVGSAVGAVVGLLVGDFMSPSSPSGESDKTNADTRKCPFCAEQVRVEAVVCRFCQRDLPSTEAGELRRAVQRQAQEDQRVLDLKPKGECPNCDAVIALDSPKCPTCKAQFGAGAAWAIKPHPK